MKRSELARETGIVRRAPLMVPMSRRGAATRLGLGKPDRPHVTPDERRAKRRVKARSGAVCEVCPDEHPGSAWHHRLNDAREAGESHDNTTVLADHETVEQFGPSSEEAA